MTSKNVDDLILAIQIASADHKKFVKIEVEDGLWFSGYQNPDIEEQVIVRLMNGCAETSYVEKIDTTVPHWESRASTVFPNIVSLYKNTPVVEVEQELEI